MKSLKANIIQILLIAALSLADQPVARAEGETSASTTAVQTATSDQLRVHFQRVQKHFLRNKPYYDVEALQQFFDAIEAWYVHGKRTTVVLPSHPSLPTYWAAHDVLVALLGLPYVVEKDMGDFKLGKNGEVSTEGFAAFLEKAGRALEDARAKQPAPLTLNAKTTVLVPARPTYVLRDVEEIATTFTASRVSGARDADGEHDERRARSPYTTSPSSAAVRNPAVDDFWKHLRNELTLAQFPGATTAALTLVLPNMGVFRSIPAENLSADELRAQIARVQTETLGDEWEREFGTQNAGSLRHSPIVIFLPPSSKDWMTFLQSHFQLMGAALPQELVSKTVVDTDLDNPQIANFWDHVYARSIVPYLGFDTPWKAVDQIMQGLAPAVQRIVEQAIANLGADDIKTLTLRFASTSDIRSIDEEPKVMISVSVNGVPKVKGETAIPETQISVLRVPQGDMRLRVAAGLAARVVLFTTVTGRLPEKVSVMGRSDSYSGAVLLPQPVSVSHGLVPIYRPGEIADRSNFIDWMALEFSDRAAASVIFGTPSSNQAERKNSARADQIAREMMRLGMTDAHVTAATYARGDEIDGGMLDSLRTEGLEHAVGILKKEWSAFRALIAILLTEDEVGDFDTKFKDVDLSQFFDRSPKSPELAALLKDVSPAPQKGTTITSLFSLEMQARIRGDSSNETICARRLREYLLKPDNYQPPQNGKVGFHSR